MGLTEEDVVAYMEEVHQTKGEGVCIKVPESIYLPNERVSTWLKLKPDYIVGMGEHLDLLIIGASYGRNSRSGMFGTFLCAVRDDTATDTGENGIWLPAAKFGTGFSYEQMSQLYTQLSPRAIPYDRRNLPSWFPHADGLHGQDAPDVLFEPRQGLVAEIIATQITASTKFSSVGCTLRFPRFAQLRLDRTCDTAMTKSEFLTLYEQTKAQPLTLKKLDFYGHAKSSSAESLQPAKPKRIGKVREIASHFKPADLKGVQRISQLFQGLQVCVLSGDKQQLETVLFENGAEIVQNPIDGETHFIVVGKVNARSKAREQLGTIDMVKPEYVFDCVSYNHLLALSPRYIVYATPSTRKVMRELMDQFGDSYTEDVTPESLMAILSSMQCPMMTREEMVDFVEDCGLQTDSSSLLQVRADIDPELDPILSLKLKLHGGVKSNANDCTHYVGLQKPSLLGQGVYAVTPNWLEDCTSQRSHLPEQPYLL
jgi:DNA ligase 4